jgi:hypothetical protein
MGAGFLMGIAGHRFHPGEFRRIESMFAAEQE